MPHTAADHHQQPDTVSRRSQLRADTARQQRTRRIRRIAGLVVGIVAVAAVVAGLWSSAPTGGDTTTTAPGFTLPTTDGRTVSLSDYRGKPVILYFNEGAGCGSCTVQMAEIEKNPGFAAAGITVLPIVMNTAEDILRDMQEYDVTTPYLLDDGTVSAAYGTLGNGMHKGLPGHGFVLIDPDGIQRWYGNYPSMWLDPDQLLQEATSRLGS